MASGKARRARDEVQICAGAAGRQRAETRFKSAKREQQARAGQARREDETSYSRGRCCSWRGGARRRQKEGRGKSRDPGRAREELGDVETRLAKVELHLIEGEQKFEEMDNRLEELDGKVDELQDELRGALDSAVDKLASEGESLRLSYLDNYAALKDENRSLREQVDRVSDENTHLREELDKVLGKLKEVEQQVSLVAIAIVQGGGANASGATMAMPSRVEVPKPSSFKGQGC
ncbi:hypothetical protein GH714_044042 [Hevea brasiliensis]|uniref:Uncharacterized protein n=1 Tax=Hevea brasiliensis TaxID=3981 RepID=A0A6A6K565_HEVBR|nr:hypothetical protein GH714_044042 [Hevea brasiliensis]